LNGDYVQINQVSPEHSHVDERVWLQDAGSYTVLPLDLKSGKFEAFAPYAVPRPNIYDVISDIRKMSTFRKQTIGRIDANTRKITLYSTPAAGSGPRRGMLDQEERLWFGEKPWGSYRDVRYQDSAIQRVAGADAGVEAV
jgi:streptogramin lyase